MKEYCAWLKIYKYINILTELWNIKDELEVLGTKVDLLNGKGINKARMQKESLTKISLEKKDSFLGISYENITMIFPLLLIFF